MLAQNWYPESTDLTKAFESETQPQRKLDLAGRRGCHRDDAELRCVDKTFGHIEVGVIEGVEELRSEL